MNPALRLLIADDHPVLREGLRSLIALQPQMEVVGEAADGAEAVAQALALRPDVILLDLVMPGSDGLAAIREIRQQDPAAKILVLTSYATDEHVFPALDAGAIGYLLKDTGRHELCEAVRTAARGGAALSPTVAAKVLAHMRGDRGAGLSGRELEVLSAVARGQSNKQIARALRLSEATVKTHLVRVYRKLGTENRASTVSEAVRRGLLELG